LGQLYLQLLVSVFWQSCEPFSKLDLVISIKKERKKEREKEKERKKEKEYL